RRTARAPPRAAASHTTGRRSRDAAGRRSLARPRDARGVSRRPLRRTHQDRVRTARAPDAQREHRPAAIDDLRTHLGLRLRPDLERTRGVRRVSASEDRVGRSTTTHPYRPRCGLRDARSEMKTDSLRTRVAFLVAGSVAGAVLLVAGGAWFVARQTLV